MSEHRQQIQDLKSQAAAITHSLHGEAAKLEEIKMKILEAELEAAKTGDLTTEQYLYALANSTAADDVQTALVNIRWAWNDNGPCSNFFLCWTYIDGAGIKFSNGTIGPFVQIYRDGKSAHACIQSALDALYASPSNPGLAVEWVMASQIHNKPLFEWLKNHPDAVVTALLSFPH